MLLGLTAQTGTPSEMSILPKDVNDCRIAGAPPELVVDIRYSLQREQREDCPDDVWPENSPGLPCDGLQLHAGEWRAKQPIGPCYTPAAAWVSPYDASRLLGRVDQFVWIAFFFVQLKLRPGVTVTDFWAILELLFEFGDLLFQL